MSDCKCDGWQKNIDQIMNAEIHMQLSHDLKYTGEAFKFCPWCSEILNKSVEDIDTVYWCEKCGIGREEWFSHCDMCGSDSGCKPAKK